MSRSDRLGKYLTFILRHKPEHLNLSLDKQGWVDLDLLLKNSNEKESFKISKEKVLEEIRLDEKGRFQISDDGSLIRCLQGHTLKNVNLEYKRENPNIKLYHGTKESVVEKILSEGILAFNRDYVHLIEDRKVAVENGQRWRENNFAILTLNTEKMIADGVEFFVSENKVWLVKGIVLPKYIENVEISKNNLVKKNNFRI